MATPLFQNIKKNLFPLLLIPIIIQLITIVNDNQNVVDNWLFTVTAIIINPIIFNATKYTNIVTNIPNTLDPFLPLNSIVPF